MKKLVTLLIFAILGSSGLTAQNKDTKDADKHFKRLEFVEAAEEYQELVLDGKADAYVYGQLAECYYNVYNSEEAERWYAKAMAAGADEPEMMFKYSQMLKANGKFDESNEWMDKFATARPSDVRAMAFRKNPNYIPKILEKGKKFNIQN